MKRHDVDSYWEEDNFNGSEKYHHMREVPDGDWVEYDLAEEMLEVLKKTHSYLTLPVSEIDLAARIQERADVIAALTLIIAKAEEE
jgi:hypothetical protein